MQCFIGPCVWLLLSEIFPLAILGFAVGLAVFTAWTVNAVIPCLFPVVIEALGSTGTFSLFVIVNSVSPVFMRTYVSEPRRTT